MNSVANEKGQGGKKMFEFTFNLSELNFITIICRMLLAIFAGGIIGMDRGIKNEAAGLRPHILVALGTTIIMMTNIYLYELFADANIDPGRMGSYVISGIGFIGAGTILVTNVNRVQGLATAASIWCAAALGLAIGSGFYAAAVAGVVLIAGIIILLRPLKRYIQKKLEDTELSFIVFSKSGFNHFLDYINAKEIEVSSLNIEQESSGTQADQGIIFTITLDIGKKIDRQDFVDHLKALDGIENIVEINT